jgi:hypothetical protein
MASEQRQLAGACLGRLARSADAAVSAGGRFRACAGGCGSLPVLHCQHRRPGWPDASSEQRARDLALEAGEDDARSSPSQAAIASAVPPSSSASACARCRDQRR